MMQWLRLSLCTNENAFAVLVRWNFRVLTCRGDDTLVFMIFNCVRDIGRRFLWRRLRPLAACSPTIIVGLPCGLL